MMRQGLSHTKELCVSRESEVFVMIGTGMNMASSQTNTSTQAVTQNRQAQNSQASTAQSSEKTNKAALEVKAESRAKAEVKREEAGKSAAQEMAKDNAIVSKPEQGIELDISKKGLEKEREAKTKESAINSDDKKAMQEQIEAEQKVREKIREQVEKELQDEKEKEAIDASKKDDERNQIQSKDDEKKPANNNFAGYSDNQLQQMYQKGEISRNDYEAEINKREDRRDQTVQTLEKTEDDVTKTVNRGRKVEQSINAIDTAYDETANENNLSAQTRADIVNNLQGVGDKARDTQNEQQQRAFAQWQSDFGFLIR